MPLTCSSVSDVAVSTNSDSEGGNYFFEGQKDHACGGKTSASAEGKEEPAEGISSWSPQQNQVDPGR
jgi:hypothetical protein